jgi:hypothetical protein
VLACDWLSSGPEDRPSARRRGRDYRILLSQQILCSSRFSPIRSEPETDGSRVSSHSFLKRYCFALIQLCALLGIFESATKCRCKPRKDVHPAQTFRRKAYRKAHTARASRRMAYMPSVGTDGCLARSWSGGGSRVREPAVRGFVCLRIQLIEHRIAHGN